MNQNLWWASAISWALALNGMTLAASTNRPTHLTCYWTLTPPVKKEFWRTQRGLRTFCGYIWTLLHTVPYQQNEPGLQPDKTFTITAWPICRPAWWYLKGATALGPSLSTSIIFTDTPLPAFSPLFLELWSS